jgi:hypothetical protein
MSDSTCATMTSRMLGGDPAANTEAGTPRSAASETNRPSVSVLELIARLLHRRWVASRVPASMKANGIQRRLARPEWDFVTRRNLLRGLTPRGPPRAIVVPRDETPGTVRFRRRLLDQRARRRVCSTRTSAALRKPSNWDSRSRPHVSWTPRPISELKCQTWPPPFTSSK